MAISEGELDGIGDCQPQAKPALRLQRPSGVATNEWPNEPFWVEICNARTVIKYFDHEAAIGTRLQINGGRCCQT
jgi:hypothetical protein